MWVPLASPLFKKYTTRLVFDLLYYLRMTFERFMQQYWSSTSSSTGLVRPMLTVMSSVSWYSIQRTTPWQHPLLQHHWLMLLLNAFKTYFCVCCVHLTPWMAQFPDCWLAALERTAWSQTSWPGVACLGHDTGIPRVGVVLPPRTHENPKIAEGGTFVWQFNYYFQSWIAKFHFCLVLPGTIQK